MLLLVSFSGLGMVLFANTVLYDKLHVKLADKGRALANQLVADCISPIITERYFEMTMKFKDLESLEKDIVYIYVESENGGVLAHTFASGVPPELRQGVKTDKSRPYFTRHISTDKGLVHDIGMPVMGGQLGVLHLGLSDQAIRKDVNDVVMLIVMFSIFFLIVGTAASVGFSRTITGPLMKLAGAAEAFGRGEMEQQVSIHSGDEIGELSRIFNEMVAKRKQTETEREQLILELQAAINEVKTLSGMLPLCSSCKKIRDDKGYWNQIDEYITEHSNAEISHGLCPECAERLYPRQWEKIRKMEE